MFQENHMFWFWICLGVGWISTAFAVSVAIYVTKDATPLLAMSIPAIAGMIPFAQNRL